MDNYDLSLEDVPAETMDSTQDAAETLAVEGQSGETSQAQEPVYHEYQANGRTIKEDIDTILQRASAGYNYSQLVSEHKTNVSDFEKQKNSHLDQYGEWKRYHDYAENNPQWADYVRNQYEQRESYGQPEGSTQQYDQPAAAFDPEIKQFMDEYRTDKANLQRQEEDRNLNAEIDSFQKQFPEIDMSKTDPETGTSIEMKILEHAKAHGIGSFQAAAKDYLFDDIVSRRITASKEAAAKEIAERSKSGVVASSSTPFSNLGNPRKTSSNSYHDLAMEAASELGIQL